MPTRRNPVVRAGAILRKGGVHRQSASGHRHQGKRALDDELDEWFVVDGLAEGSAELCSPESESADCSRRSKRRRGWNGPAPGGVRAWACRPDCSDRSRRSKKRRGWNGSAPGGVRAWACRPVTVPALGRLRQ